MPVIGQGVEICTSTTRPTNPVVGTIIYETDTASYRWCTSLGPIVWTSMIPVGTVQSFAGTTAPPGWLFCFGQSLNASTSPQYADLFGVLGTTYGGSSISAFNVPDLRGRVAAGKDNMGGNAANRITSGGAGITGNTLGASGGSQTHTLTVAQLASHGHNAPSGMHFLTNQNNAPWSQNNFAGNINMNGGFTTQSTGSNEAHQNTQPTIILNYIIKF